MQRHEPSTLPNQSGIPKYDLIIIGGGSAAFSAAIKAEELGSGRYYFWEGGVEIELLCKLNSSMRQGYYTFSVSGNPSIFLSSQRTKTPPAGLCHREVKLNPKPCPHCL